MKENELTRSEHTELLKEIVILKAKKSELYTKSGPSSPDYVDLSIKLNYLVAQYIDEQIEGLLSE